MVLCLIYSNCVAFNWLPEQSETVWQMAEWSLEKRHVSIQPLSDRSDGKNPQKVNSLDVISHFVPCTYSGMMTPWWCLLLKIHQRRRTWKTEWLWRWRSTQIRVPFSSADMVSMSGGKRGKKLRPCEHLPASIFNLFDHVSDQEFISVFVLPAYVKNKMYLSSAAFCRCECYDYLFDIAVQMKQCGLDPSALPMEEKGIVWHSEVLF